MKVKSTSSFPGLNASRHPSKPGDMLAQKKIDEAWRLTPEQRLCVASGLSDVTATLHRAGSRKHSDRKIL